MSNMDYLPAWYRRLVKWTSPAWYLFLLYTALMLIGICFYVAFTKDE